MRIARLRMQRFRGFADETLVFVRHSVIAGESRAGRTDIVEALRRVLDPRSTRNRVNPLDIYQGESAGGEEPVLTEVEATLLELGTELEDLLWQHITMFNPKTGALATLADAWIAVRGISLCYRARYDADTDQGEHWVDYTHFSTPSDGDVRRVRTVERQALPVLFLRSGSPLQVTADGTLRALIEEAAEGDLAEALAGLDNDVRSATSAFSQSAPVTEGIVRVLQGGARELLGINGSECVQLVPEDGTLAGLLRTLEPVISLDSAGPLPTRSHGSTAEQVLSTAEAVATAVARSDQVVVIADDFGDRLDAAAAEYLAQRLQRAASQVILTTRRSEVVRAFPAEELLRLTRHGGARRCHRLSVPNKEERIRRRLILDQLVAAVTAKTVVLMEGPTDVEGFGAVAGRMARTEEQLPSLAAHGTRLVCPPGSDGGKSRLPGLAALALAIGFRVRVVLDGDKSGIDEMIAALPDGIEQILVLPKGVAVEAALMRGISPQTLRAAIDELTASGELPAVPDGVPENELAQYLIGKSPFKKYGLHAPWVDVLADIPPLARQVVETLCAPAGQNKRLDLPDTGVHE
ncbi:hypothetical protein E3G44_000373 [Mycobacteroides abscessus]|uniref:Uncharacterized protein n=1 Tax=Mycobacteroides abscessus 21 TaxID=1299324 RepID=A0A829PZL9_9MYCO|nr:hypothetical protein I543_2762 [Mycobacteroides abscessus 21]MBE5492909.1 hypothetical protein [Mycobacteroides abscessus]SHO95492.1 recombination protein F [Mycobacteroides abscessus subsp. abscessus]SHP89505.1 recombination protein F [Mycobacteroides abscessus subsp. abscessus]SHP92752.1 recombination protein F [Mycobacteroides abscessus subsp. abscessus]